MTEPQRQHNHPMAGPVVVVHIRHADQPLNAADDNPAHAFGPYPSEEVAMRTEAAMDDTCHKVILDLFDPLESAPSTPEPSGLTDAPSICPRCGGSGEVDRAAPSTEPALDVDAVADDVRYAGGNGTSDYWRGYNDGIDKLVARIVVP